MSALDNLAGLVAVPPSKMPTTFTMIQLDNTYGAVLIGTFIGLAMYGLMLYQTYRYARLYPGDPWSLKAVVLAFLVLNTLYTVTTAHACYHYLVSKYFEPFALYDGTWSLEVMSATSGAIVFLAQAFYVRRLWLLKQCSKTLVAIMVFLMFGELSLWTAVSIEGFLQVTYHQWQLHVSWLDVTIFITALAVDIILAATLVINLHRTQTHFKSTATQLEILMAYTINTCLLTSAINAVCLVFILAYQHNLIWVGISIPAMRMYGIAVLAVLNSRKSLHKLRGRTNNFGTFGLNEAPVSSGTDASDSIV